MKVLVTGATSGLGRNAVEYLRSRGISVRASGRNEAMGKLLEKMGDTGKAYPLIEGTGQFYGLYIVSSISKTKTEFFNDGAARRIEFSAKFTRVDDNDRGLLGILNVSDIDFGSTLGGLL